MSSQARTAFNKNAKDIERLMELHEEQGGTAKGRRHGLEVLNKSAIVLLTSFWEAYCEDIAAEGLNHIVLYAPNAERLSVDLKRIIANELKKNEHELAIWAISGDGWRTVLSGRLASLQLKRNRKLNAPKAVHIDSLFQEALGIPCISKRWKWDKKMTPTRARAKLDKYVELRGSIAHRGRAEISVKKAQVLEYFEFLKQMVAHTGGSVNRHALEITGRPMWSKSSKT